MRQQHAFGFACGAGCIRNGPNIPFIDLGIGVRDRRVGDEGFVVIAEMNDALHGLKGGCSHGIGRCIIDKHHPGLGIVADGLYLFSGQARIDRGHGGARLGQAAHHFHIFDGVLGDDGNVVALVEFEF